MGQKDTGPAEVPGIAELRTNVLVALADTPHPLVAVTSPRDDTGRLDVAAALAASAERTGRRVALVDADVAARREGTEEPEQTATVTARAVSETNAALLLAEDFRRSLADTAAANDLVVVACPPVLDMVETRAVTAACTATVLVASQRTSRRDCTVQAAEVLRAAGAQILGVALRRS